MFLAEGGSRGLPRPAELMGERGRVQVPPEIRMAAELRLESSEDLEVLRWGQPIFSFLSGRRAHHTPRKIDVGP